MLNDFECSTAAHDPYEIKLVTPCALQNERTTLIQTLDRGRDALARLIAFPITPFAADLLGDSSSQGQQGDQCDTRASAIQVSAAFGLAHTQKGRDSSLRSELARTSCWRYFMATSLPQDKSPAAPTLSNRTRHANYCKRTAHAL